ncbi:hypothetical protein K488DRAFT_72468 [Vararia minispora EC-137]|uniref:Uncharacterized protein n=1 Tax=Vararia minispora EC-137 TaxID=1314806 RepID=A0ACB8QEI4_9AGAM|nr:hypothetical protein K488DRAFT_72468 [Vararia minispora EC-137]
MPGPVRSSRSRFSKEATQEPALRDAVSDREKKEGTKAGSYTNVAQMHGVPRSTLYGRATGRNKSRSEAHTKQQRLNDVEEAVVVEWAEFLSLLSIPWSKEQIRWKVLEICGRRPSRDWVNRFLIRHPELRPSKGNRLDRKRAGAFNIHVVNEHFEGLRELFGGHIPARNVFNFDELGVQLGGGRTNNGRKYIYHVKDKAKYRMSDDNLELVTVLETLCLDGTAPIKPAFLFSGKSKHCEEWYAEDPGVL